MPANNPVSSALVQLMVQTVTAPVAAVDFTSGIDGTFDEYVFTWQNVVGSVNNEALYARTSANGGTSFDNAAGAYAWAMLYNLAVGSVLAQGANGGSTATGILLTGPNGISNVVANGGCSGSLRLVNPAGTVCNKQMRYSALQADAGGQFEQVFGSAERIAIAAVNASRFVMGSGNIVAGKFKLEGSKK